MFAKQGEVFDAARRSVTAAVGVDPREVVYSDEAVGRLPGVCGRAVARQRVAVLMDVRTRDVAGAAAAEALRRSQWLVREVVVEDPAAGKSPVCDDVTKDRVAAEVGDEDLILAVGSGVINDLAKWAAAEKEIPYVVLATAASMTGYASANVAPAVRGVKTLVRGRAPVAVLASPRILCEAPPEMTSAGLGDVLAKSVSGTDWRLNHLLFGDDYVAEAVDLVEVVEPLYVTRPEALREGDAAAMEGLFAALLLVGVSMTLAKTSSPASGGEHMVSHALDMMSSVDGHEHDLHGRQVGVGTILASEVYRRVLAIESPTFAEPQADIDAAFWGNLTPAVREAYAEKIPRLEAARRALAEGDAWDRLRTELREMIRPPEWVRDCLVRGGGATTAEGIKCAPERLLAAFSHAHEMRSRFTILDLARLVGVLPAATADIVEEWA